MRLASPHPGLRLVALFVVGLAIGASLAHPGTASRSSKDDAGRTALPSEPLASMRRRVDSPGVREERGIRPAGLESQDLTPVAAVPIVSFEGLHFGTNGPYSNRVTPPDVQIAVGPKHTVELVNLLGRISTRQGVEVQSLPLHTLFGVPYTDFIRNPKVHFELESCRWYYSQHTVPIDSG